jgi:hypothetical protein
MGLFLQMGIEGDRARDRPEMDDARCIDILGSMIA